MATESWVVSGPQIIELDDIAALRVGLVAGRVDVVTHDDDSTGARVEVHSVDGEPLEVSLERGELRVGYPSTLGGWENFLEKFRNFSDRDSASVHIAVPRTVPVKLGTVTAEGLLVGTEEDAQVSTVSGSLVTDSTRGQLVARTVSGEITVRAHSGDAKLNTVSGDLTASGDLARVSAKSVSGDVSLDMTSQSSKVSASTVSGDVTVRLPDGVGVSVDARSVSGRVVVDGAEHKGSSPGKVKVDQRSEGTGAYLSTNTVSGHLTVLRLGAA